MSPDTADKIAAANPLSDDAAARLAIDAAEHEMLEALIASPAAPADSRVPWRPDARRRRPLLAVIGAVAVAIPVIAVLAVLPTGRQGHGGPVGAAAHKVHRPAGASPLILLQLRGWRVWYADEQSPLIGEVSFARDRAAIHKGAPVTGSTALNWYPARQARGYIQDRASEAAIKTTMRVLGATAHVVQYKGGPPSRHAFSAIWTLGPRVFELRATARSMSAVRDLLTHMRFVDTATWLKAMPRSVVTTAHRNAVIRMMLRAIPLPPGFNMRQIPGATLVRDHYQLGSAVTGVVACEWFARWGHARKVGNRAEVANAVAAMDTAKHWPILQQMSKQGGWTQVLLGYAKAMGSGRWSGRPLLPEVNSGLGCSGEWHIKLGNFRPPGGLRPVKSSSSG